MHASPVLDAEHLAVFGARDATTGVITGGLVPDSSLTYISVPSATPENWSDPSTWRYVGPAPTDGSTPSPIPGAGANVLISLGSVVIVDAQFSSPLHTIRDDGTLRFDPHANTLLSVDTIIVEPEGVFQMGTDPTQARPAQPHRHGPADRCRQAGQSDLRRHRPDRSELGIHCNSAADWSRTATSASSASTVTSFEQLAVDAKVKDKTLVLAQHAHRLESRRSPGPHRRHCHQQQGREPRRGSADRQRRHHDRRSHRRHDHRSQSRQLDRAEIRHPVASGYVSDVSRNATFESQNVDDRRPAAAT